MSEHSDAVVAIVSEETGSISVAVGGMLKRHLAPETLDRLLRNELKTDEDDGEKKSDLFPLVAALFNRGKKGGDRMIQRIQNSKWVFVLISVFLAVIFWMYVRNDLDPPGSRTIYNVPVTLTGETILESQGLTITAVSDTAVDLKITAPISILNKLSNRNLSVTVNVSQCTEGEQILQYDVNWPRDVSTAEITKESQEPAAITVMVARLYSRPLRSSPC